MTALIIGIIIMVYTSMFNTNIPDISPLAGLIWSVGILYAIVKYRLMVLTPAIAAENILQTIVDSVVLASPDGSIININDETQRLLDYKSDELVGEQLGKLFAGDNRFVSDNIAKLLKKGPIRNFEAFIIPKNGSSIPVIVSASECKDNNDNKIGYVVVSRDITKLRDIENRLKYLAHHDALTNLPNRLLLNDRLNQAIARAKYNNTYVAIMLMDLDRFKEVNDVLGHNTGDMLLIEVAKRLIASVRESDTVVRLGGDEFVILINDMTHPDDYEETARRILKYISALYIIEMNEIKLTASMGVSLYPINGNDIENLMKNADLAMYSAKNNGRNNYHLYTPSLSMAVLEKVNLGNSLQNVLSNNELLLYYQPVIDISTGVIIGVEALIRWNHPEYGLITPSRFIPLAEESGIMIPIGEWVFRTACLQAKKWQDAGYPPIHISVNLSTQQFQQKNLVDIILGILNETGLDPEYFLLEITESTVMHDMENTIVVLEKLFKHKIMVIIDDFGAGYSSLLYLRKLPIYAIKIDKFFTTDIANDPECAAIVSAIIAIAHNMKLKVIAEGIDNPKQFECLRSLDWQFVGSSLCDGVQGYLFSEPVLSDKIETLFNTQKKGNIPS